MIDFACCQCQKLLRVKETASGKNIVCPNCQTKQIVPAPAVDELEVVDIEEEILDVLPAEEDEPPPRRIRRDDDEYDRPRRKKKRQSYHRGIEDRDPYAWGPLDGTFVNTNVIVLVLFGLCCNGLAMILGIVGIFVTQNHEAKRNAILLAVIGGIMTMFGFFVQMVLRPRYHWY